jgi:hypothetical protein
MDQQAPSRAEIDAEIKRSKSWDDIVTEGNKGAGMERTELAYLIGGFVVAGIIVVALFHTI